MIVTIFLALATAVSTSVYVPSQDSMLIGQASRAVFKLSNIVLDDLASCKGVGLTPADRTLGDFLGSTMGQFANKKFGKPILRVAVAGQRENAIPVEVTFAYQRRGDDDRWRWGLRFDIASATGEPDPASVQCFVAG